MKWIPAWVRRDYVSLVPLVLLAVVLMVLGYSSDVEDNSLIAVGWGFAGASIVRWVDIVQERSREKARADETRRRDLDETRRLLYMEIYRTYHGNPEVLASIINALAHHSLLVNAGEAASILSSGNRNVFAWQLIAKINEELGDAGPPSTRSQSS